MAKLLVRILSSAKSYLDGLSDAEKGTVAANIAAMESGEFGSIHTKQLKGPIRELIFGNHRISYFQLNALLCFVRGFRKRTAKAPKGEIEYAEKTYKQMEKTIKQTKK